jgi:uncharacterized membrane protein
MVIWGVVCGAVLAAVLHRGGDFFDSLVAGAILGAIFGATLKSTIRSEVRKALADRTLAPAARETSVPARVEAPAASATAGAAAPVETSPHVTVPPREFQETIPQPAVATAGAPTAGAATAGAATADAPRSTPAPRKPDLAEVMFARARDWLLGGNTVVRVGVLVLFVGLAFLAKYAIDNALLPPELRLAGIAVAGIALFMTGFRLRAREGVHRGYALTLQGAGVAVLYLTVFAAFRLYGFLPSGAAFAALALVCAFSAVIAVKQDAMLLAFIGFAGGFAAPILVSTGQGSHVALFTYYLLLGVAIAALAFVKAWRALNLLGFLATFLLATAWGVLQYKPAFFGTTQPFLVAFFAVYLVAALAYALRHSLPGSRAVDATMIFGVPLVAFGLQWALVRDVEYAAAFSALALGALYLGLAAWLLRSTRGDATVHRWLAECFFALGLGFATLAVPLALDARWTSAVWAVEGAGVFWMGRRQGRWLARLVGLALQVFAAFAYLEGEAWRVPSAWPLVQPAFIGATLLAVAAFAIAWTARKRPDRELSGFDAVLVDVETRLSPLAFWIGFAWWQVALHAEIHRFVLDTQGALSPVFGQRLRMHLEGLGWMASAFAAHFLALPKRREPWAIAATPAWTVMPALIAWAILSMATMNHVFEGGGWVVWPVVLVMHFIMLRNLDGGTPQPWWRWVHAGGVWLLVLLGGNLLVDGVDKAELWQTAWASVILLVSGTCVLLLLCAAPWWRDAQRWPLDRFSRDYLWRAAAPLAVLVALGSLLVAMLSGGNAKPLPYVPLLNPTDLAVALGIASCAMWLQRVRASSFALPGVVRGRGPVLAVAAVAFIAINTVWLRVAHHFGGVAWDASTLFASFLVQAGYSILWTLIAVALMVVAHRQSRRGMWTAGAALIGLTVVKLFLIDLSNRGGSERIVTFIAVGVLLLVVGYFAPMPPASRPKSNLQGAAP